MKKVVIIGANDFQNPLILKAKELGYETHVFAWKDGSIGEKTADYVGLAFKENVKNERIHFFYIILLCYRILQDCEGVKDTTAILFFKWIDKP